MTNNSDSTGSRANLNFDGDYGRNYKAIIRGSVPGYDTMLEITAAALADTCTNAESIVVVGPGRGEELPLLLAALPTAQFTLIEPSAQMQAACRKEIEQANAVARCKILDVAISPDSDLEHEQADAVVCLNVLHLMPKDEQIKLLHSIADQIKPGGTLLIAAHSEPNSEHGFETLLGITKQRLRDRGATNDVIERMMQARNTSVYSLDQSTLEQGLSDSCMISPILLQQSLFSRLWISQKSA